MMLGFSPLADIVRSIGCVPTNEPRLSRALVVIGGAGFTSGFTMREKIKNVKTDEIIHKR